jgi:AcrR family transcriptional regulator
MNAMSTPYDSFGRTDQKSRTRAALVAAARDLVARGASPTVAQAAAAASVARTTAYRYFPNQRALLGAAHPETAARSMLGDDPSTDPVERLDAVLREFTSMVVETEAQQRTMLRLSLDDVPGELPLRQGRAVGWIAEALEPLHGRLSGPQLHSLVLAIRSATGIEALVWLTDIAALSRSEAVDLMRWSAHALLQSALTSAPPAPDPAPVE